MQLALSSMETSKVEPAMLEKTFGTDTHEGLSEDEAKKRLLVYGENKIDVAKKPGVFSVLLEQLREPMILLLIFIAVLYTIFGNVADSLVIVMVVFLVVIIEVINVNRANKSIDALKDLRTPTALVMRNGRLVRIKSVSIVPGDIVQLTSGERVPADGRLITSFNLKVDESSLTGESFPVLKDSDRSPDGELMAELTNMAFSGTLVVQGTSLMVVSSTGRNTEIGRISKLVEEAETIETPLDRSVSSITKILASLAIGFSVLFPVIGYFQGQDLNDMLLTGLSMAFATVPEELPVLISITLAIGAYTLARHKAVVNNLRAAETLGSVTVIATDKTGTLTENRMSVGHMFYKDQVHEGKMENDIDFLSYAVLATGTVGVNPDEPTSYRDPMEISVLEDAQKNGVNTENLRSNFKLIEEFSFDNRIKLSSFMYRKADESIYLYVSGAPEVVLDNSTSILLSDGAIGKFDVAMRENLSGIVDGLSSDGERVIAIAMRELPSHSEKREEVENNFTFLGLISFIDPARNEVGEAIRQCQIAGINVIMLTGDHPKTAKAIADKVGISNSGEVINGSQLEGMNDEALTAALRLHSIFARITSEDKYRIVKSLQREGEVVAVTGDGVNDSPALQTAEIGIAMGIRGTDVAREASDMILLDDNFATIVDAVHEGRKILSTLKKSLTYEISIKIALVIILAIPLFLFIPFPFSPIQIIVMELMMDLGAMGGFLYEKEERDFLRMTSKNRGRNFINRGLMLYILASAIIISVAVTAVYLYLYYTSGFILRAQTAAFAVWMLTQVFLAHNLRTERQPILLKGFFSNKILVTWAVVAALALLIITIIPDLQVLLHTIYLTSWDWIIIVSASLASTFWIEAMKMYWHFADKGKNPSA